MAKSMSDQASPSSSPPRSPTVRAHIQRFETVTAQHVEQPLGLIHAQGATLDPAHGRRAHGLRGVTVHQFLPRRITERVPDQALNVADPRCERLASVFTTSSRRMTVGGSLSNASLPTAGRTWFR